MNHEEKVKFLFEQTCRTISGPLALAPNMSIPLDQRVGRYFDATYAVLEKKLEEKLKQS
ncbi:TPA: hypothetical protein QHZ91_001481 [Enterobacter hormaechei subsp. xiangfangensis]|uniref:hypothetical protein n=1 Tax=Enterobacter hormaechei TaxID=158836 RepID=UPI000791A3C2|nr:hypothetical protein [Enterobacter hormaechei]SAC06835.1 Uncharacterised protein [Enterobacter hormaechei]HDS5129579.1 hypothetical protein [Enterobacter hormaechei subsp. xiangfangensis]